MKHDCGSSCGEAAEVNVLQTIALNDRAGRGEEIHERRDRFLWLFSEKLGTVLHSLKISSLLSFFLPLVC